MSTSRSSASTSPTLLAALLLAIAACGDDGAPGPDAGPGDPTPMFDDDGMHIDVRSQVFGGGAGATSITALLSTTPAPWPYDAPTTAGACRMFVRHDVDGCNPACPATSMCDAGTCRPLPVPTSAGPLTIAGGGASRSIPFDDGYQLYLSTALFDAGDDITASAPGVDLPSFSLTARLPTPLTLVDTDQLVLAPGHPLTIRWTTAGDGSRVRVALGADLGHAQWRTVVVECDVPDDVGAVTVPQAMVDVLADRRNWSCGDCFGHEVRRYRRASITYPGPGAATSLTLWALQSASLYLIPSLPAARPASPPTPAP